MWLFCHCKILFWSLNIYHQTQGKFFLCKIILIFLYISLYFVNNFSSLTKKDMVIVSSKCLDTHLFLGARNNGVMSPLLLWPTKYLEPFLAQCNSFLAQGNSSGYYVNITYMDCTFGKMKLSFLNFNITKF